MPRAVGHQSGLRLHFQRLRPSRSRFFRSCGRGRRHSRKERRWKDDAHSGLSGLLTPNQGEVWLKDRPLQSYKKSELYRTLGLVFQNPNDQVVEFRVLEDVLFGPKNLGIEPLKAKGRALNALKRVGLEGFEERLVRTLSFGEMKRLSIAGLLAMDPSVLILDEPTQGLDRPVK